MLRLTDRELISLLDGIESDRAERKAAYRGDVPKKSRQAVCAFAKDLPFDNHPIPAAAIRDLSRTIFENEYLPSAFADDVLKTFGFIQAFGRGIAVARSAMKENGNPPLEFQTSQTAMLCTLRGRS